MYAGKLVFSRVMDHLPMHAFRRCVSRYQGERYVKQVRCLDQHLVMAFAQPTNSYADFAQVLIRIARPLHAGGDLGLDDEKGRRLFAAAQARRSGKAVALSFKKLSAPCERLEGAWFFGQPPTGGAAP